MYFQGELMACPLGVREPTEILGHIPLFYARGQAGTPTGLQEKTDSARHADCSQVAEVRSESREPPRGRVSFGVIERCLVSRRLVLGVVGTAGESAGG